MIVTEEMLKDKLILRIEHRGYKISDNIEFWNEIDTLYEKGYRFSDPINIAHSPTFYPIAMVEFEKKESDVVEKLNSKIQSLEDEVKILKDSVVQDVVEEDNTKEVESVVIGEVVEEDDEIIKLTPLEELEGFSKKDPLLKFAERNGIVVPPEKVVASAIKKYIKETLKA